MAYFLFIAIGTLALLFGGRALGRIVTEHADETVKAKLADKIKDYQPKTLNEYGIKEALNNKGES
jgi:hypothetical protein